MKIRTTLLTLLALLFAVMIVLEIGVQRQILMPSFAALEREDAQTSMRRIDYALDTTLASLELSAADWGNWADVFRFVQSPTPEFVSANITAVALKQLQVNVLMIVDLRGDVVLADARDLESGASLPLGLVRERTLPLDFPWRRHLAAGEPARGLIRTDRGILLVAEAPIRDGSGHGRSLGMVVMGRLLSPRQVQILGAQAQADLTLLDADVGGDRVVETDEVTRVYRPVSDLYGRPLLRFRIDVPRRITAQGRGALTYALWYLIGAGAAALVVLAFVLNRLVLAPLDRVTRHAVAIGEGSDLTARLELPGDDEVAVLAREFDRMVGRVADSRRLLVDQSFQAGFAVLAKGVMHNLGNAMTPLGVRLEKLAAGLRDAPVTDVDRAVRELEHQAAGTARRADLEEFLRLGCRELNAVIRVARDDVTVIQRQSGVVQTALVELMRSTHSDHVLEPVRLPELVSQTLEIVPDTCRRRLLVESDDSLRRVGLVQVARTVLRLVLQNLIINAADAVREAGRERGVLRVAAEIVRDADCDTLHLRCDDNGVGIPRDQLQRVFEQGFSTKSRETHHGIGLHWCANAMAALGGRIWAASEGPGRGTCMHLMVPLRGGAIVRQ